MRQHGCASVAGPAIAIAIVFATAITTAGLAPRVAADSGRGTQPAAITVYFQGDPQAAFSTLRNRARNGDAIAQYFVGRAWLTGHGTRVDPAIAYAWFAASEANGHWPGRQARRRLHSRLRVGDLPRGERLARRYVTRFSPQRIPVAPCYASVSGNHITRCRPDWLPEHIAD